MSCGPRGAGLGWGSWATRLASPSRNPPPPLGMGPGLCAACAFVRCAASVCICLLLAAGRPWFRESWCRKSAAGWSPRAGQWGWPAVATAAVAAAHGASCDVEPLLMCHCSVCILLLLHLACSMQVWLIVHTCWHVGECAQRQHGRPGHAHRACAPRHPCQHPRIPTQRATQETRSVQLTQADLWAGFTCDCCCHPPPDMCTTPAGG